MLKRVSGCFLVLSLLAAFPFGLSALAASLYGDGAVDLSNGLESRELRYQGFDISPDGTISGAIVNTSNRPVQGIKLDMWLTNANETMILWRKTLNIGDMAAGARHEIKESWTPPDMEDLSKVKFKFRVPSNINFRNSSSR
jgi:hypothetical protein